MTDLKFESRARAQSRTRTLIGGSLLPRRRPCVVNIVNAKKCLF